MSESSVRSHVIERMNYELNTRRNFYHPMRTSGSRLCNGTQIEEHVLHIAISTTVMTYVLYIICYMYQRLCITSMV